MLVGYDSVEAEQDKVSPQLQAGNGMDAGGLIFLEICLSCTKHSALFPTGMSNSRAERRDWLEGT